MTQRDAAGAEEIRRKENPKKTVKDANLCPGRGKEKKMIYCDAEYCTNNIDGICGLTRVHMKWMEEWAVCEEYEDYREVDDDIH